MSKQVTIKDIVQRINSSWRKTTDGVLDTAKLCWEAKQLFEDATERKLLIEQLQFDQSTFSKLATIGERLELYDEPIRPALPGNSSIVSEIARLDDAVVEKALTEPVVRPARPR